MPKLTLTDITSNYASVQQLNVNFQAIEDMINDRVLLRDNVGEEPNWMEQDLDMNSFCILNVCDATANHMAVNYGQLLAVINRLNDLEDRIDLLEEPTKTYIQQTDPSGTHNSTKPFLWIETDAEGCPVTFWVEANP